MITKVYFDMDGVWTNWQCTAIREWLKHTGVRKSIVELNRDPAFHKWIYEVYHKGDVFATLPEMGDVKYLIALVHELESVGIEVAFLTACGAEGNKELLRMHADKCFWLSKRLPENEREVITVSTSREKYKYATAGVVLVDDFDNNCKQWIEHGGRAVLHKNACQTIAELQVLIPELTESK